MSRKLQWSQLHCDPFSSIRDVAFGKTTSWPKIFLSQSQFKQVSPIALNQTLWPNRGTILSKCIGVDCPIGWDLIASAGTEWRITARDFRLALFGSDISCTYTISIFVPETTTEKFHISSFTVPVASCRSKRHRHQRWFSVKFGMIHWFCRMPVRKRCASSDLLFQSLRPT